MFNKAGKAYQFLKTVVKPSAKRNKTREYKENLMFKRLGNEQKKMEDFAIEKRNEASKKLFKDK